LVVGFRDFVQHEHALLEECFGPIALVVMCDGEDDFMSAASMLPGSLVSTLHGEADGDRDLVTQLVPLLAQKSGRVVMNGWPTGVAVSHSQHHGGPYPASTAALHTSVGSHAMMRFVRPVVLQNFDSGLWPSISV
jgi:NADP-dependent aldehyde dehydrogenase